jgi:hypothetical protein
MVQLLSMVPQLKTLIARNTEFVFHALLENSVSFPLNYCDIFPTELKTVSLEPVMNFHANYKHQSTVIL